MLDLVATHDGVVVVDKPAGLASTGRDLNDPDCVQSLLVAQLRRTRVWAVHQLDKLTSGLNVFVLRKALVAEWSERLRYPRGTKTYLAVAAGVWPSPNDEGELHVRAPIGRAARGPKTFPAISAAGKAAHSVVRRVDGNGHATLVTVELRTGRTHQVRLHLASIGLPIVGDPLHGKTVPAVSEQGLALHAWRLELIDGPAPLRSLDSACPARLHKIAEHMGLAF